MKNYLRSIVLACLVIGCASTKGEKTIQITIKNSLDFDRTHETVSLSKDFLKIADLNSLVIKNAKTNNIEITQLVDNDSDGTMDEILFQPKVAAHSNSTFIVVKTENKTKTKENSICYSRFVPERTDDYAWENDRVAFRIFGPNAQYRFENKLKAGTLSSGVDAWLKRVEYPIINKWYKKYTEKTGSYHKDTGEGFDNFHVGKSRGVGGLAYKEGTKYYISKNFTKWKTITTGPIRTSFYVEYDTWGPKGKPITESRIISLDKGSNLSKFEVTLKGTNTISTGLTLHKKKGKVTFNKENSWLNYWEPHGDSELGIAIVSTPKHLKGYEKYDVSKKDLSNAYAHLNVLNNKVIYYTGFAWKKSQQFKNKEEWENYLTNFSKKIASPLQKSIN